MNSALQLNRLTRNVESIPTSTIPLTCRAEFVRPGTIHCLFRNTNDWTIPLNLQFGKTIIANGRPWKLAMELNYYVEQPDPFGPDWMIGFIVTPVVTNRVAGWFK